MASAESVNSLEVKLLRAQAAELLALGRMEALGMVYAEILKHHPGDAEALNGLGVIAFLSKQWRVAVDYFQKAVRADPLHAQFRLNLVKAYHEDGQLELAEQECRSALKSHAGWADLHLELSQILLAQLKNPEALAEINEALKIKPDAEDAWQLKGVILYAARRLAEARECFLRVTQQRPADATAWHYLAQVLMDEDQNPAEAIRAISRAIKLAPDNPILYKQYGLRLAKWTLYALAAEAFMKAAALAPGEEFSLGCAIHDRMMIGDWRQLEALLNEAQERLHRGERVWEPFGFMGLAHSEADLQKCAQIFCAVKYPRVSGVVQPAPRAAGGKIRIGYLAGELRQHATSLLMTGVFELHDRSRFEVYAFDNGWDDGSELRKRQNVAFQEIINISQLGEREAAQVIAEKNIDILIDLNGFFGASRQEVLALKPSPIQVSYLGCPGTMGTDYIDYIIADAVTIPEASEKYYNEKVVRLPYTYQANDFKRQVAERIYTRAEVGLPEQGFVFCCFNNNYKILPEVFGRWMQILQKVPGSVLWLIMISPDSILNLRREAEKRGVHPDRLVFAQGLPPPEHLARQRLADLFLDTLPYNAHTTASDALWMGLPVVTLVGTTFAGRVAASLLTALEVPELITHTPAAYEALAVELATQPEKLRLIRAKIIAHRDTKPLFNTALFARHFDQALVAIYQRHQNGLKPEALRILDHGAE